MIKLFTRKNHYIKKNSDYFEAINFETGKDNLTNFQSNYVYKDNIWKINPENYDNLKLVLEYK